MSIFWSNIVKEIEPYVPGEQPKDKKYIKLNTNENPYPPSTKVLQAIKNAANGDLRLYPDPTCSCLIDAISSTYGINSDEVFVGNGSDEVLAFSFMAFFNPGDTILFADITYSFYEVYADLFRVNYNLVPLNEEFDISLEGYFKENKGIIIANPNAPTGKIVSIEDIKKVLSYNKNSVVIVDEAYIDFGGDSSYKLISQFPNLLVVRTLSKSMSLAGLRVGFALGNKELIEGLNRVKNSINSYTLDRIALIGAKEAFGDMEYYHDITNKIISTRDNISARLKGLGFKVLDSKANFVFVSHPKVHASLIFQSLKENGILVRYFKKPRIDNYLRISIGTDEEMDSLYDALLHIIK